MFRLVFSLKTLHDRSGCFRFNPTEPHSTAHQGSQRTPQFKQQFLGSNLGLCTYSGNVYWDHQGSPGSPLRNTSACCWEKLAVTAHVFKAGGSLQLMQLWSNEGSGVPNHQGRDLQCLYLMIWETKISTVVHSRIWWPSSCSICSHRGGSVSWKMRLLRLIQLLLCDPLLLFPSAPILWPAGTWKVSHITTRSSSSGQWCGILAGILGILLVGRVWEERS